MVASLLKKPNNRGKWQRSIQGGGGTWKRDQHSLFLFQSPGWPLLYLPNTICFFHVYVFGDVFWSWNIVLNEITFLWMIFYQQHFVELDLRLEYVHLRAPIWTLLVRREFAKPHHLGPLFFYSVVISVLNHSRAPINLGPFSSLSWVSSAIVLSSGSYSLVSVKFCCLPWIGFYSCSRRVTMNFTCNLCSANLYYILCFIILYRCFAIFTARK